jgi:type III secretion protein N (ATPase)
MSIQAGELPIRQGLTNSVFQELPGLFERAGNTKRGSITAFYTLLTNSGSGLETDPLADEVCSLLDGHLVLSQELAAQGIYPALSIGKSLSRLQDQVCSDREQEIRRRLFAEYEKAEREEKFLFLYNDLSKEIENAFATKTRMLNYMKQSRGCVLSESQILQELQQLQNC